MRARFREEVAEEVNDAIDFYEADSETAGGKFEAEFRRVLQEIKAHPERGSPTLGRARRRRLQRFPYSIIYLIRPDHVYIVAVAHFSREWGYWLDRLEDQ
jgi:plasmid stabilization system protein ParE